MLPYLEISTKQNMLYMLFNCLNKKMYKNIFIIYYKFCKDIYVRFKK